ncbi:MAG: hypothetical protein KDB18_06250, partial [Salinibacterium sp.]|nr:hypothetical protein [Salinibacterium sp.]
LEAWRATALWLVAPGFVQDDVAFENAERITGIAIRKPDRDHRTWVRSTARLGKLEFGSATVQAHTPIVVDTDAEDLAHYVDDGHVALARRKMGAWTSIYSAVPILHPELLGLLLA